MHASPFFSPQSQGSPPGAGDRSQGRAPGRAPGHAQAAPINTIAGLEIRYERSFLLDLLDLPTTPQRQIQRFVFTDFYQLASLQELPQFHRLLNSEIYYRFTFADQLILLEVAGRLIKFVRVLPCPRL
jgi:hypothetical protein